MGEQFAAMGKLPFREKLWISAGERPEQFKDLVHTPPRGFSVVGIIGGHAVVQEFPVSVEELSHPDGRPSLGDLVYFQNSVSLGFRGQREIHYFDIRREVLIVPNTVHTENPRQQGSASRFCYVCDALGGGLPASQSFDLVL
jgi:hypothetical protein